MVSPLFVALTADVDPDANRAVPGRIEAVTAGARGSVRTGGCLDGLRRVLAVLQELELPCTFFWEARTLGEVADSAPELLECVSDDERFEHACHGLHHEDFAGLKSGMPITSAEALAILREATAVIESVTGGRPRGFRAPYCRLTVGLIGALVELGYQYDASLGAPADESDSLRPFPLRSSEAGLSLWEVPLCQGKDREGNPLSSYLWQLFENSRRAADYVHLAETARQQCGGGLLQIGLHPWHLWVSEDGQRLPESGRTRNVERLRRVLRGIQRLDGVRFCTVGGYLAQWLRGQST